MIKNIGLFSLLLLLSIVSFPCLAAAPQWPAVDGIRLHYTRQLSDGSVLAISVIDWSHGQDAANNREHYQVVTLVDGGVTFGRWVITKTVRGDLGFHARDTQVHFMLLDTHEELVVHHQIDAGKSARARCATFGRDSIDLPTVKSQLTTPTNAGSNFLQGRASSIYLKGLKLLWSLAHVASAASLGSCQQDLDAFCGNRLGAADGMPSYNLTPVSVDCNFDAGFGFPCEADESPREGTKRMVYSKKLPQADH